MDDTARNGDTNGEVPHDKDGDLGLPAQNGKQYTERDEESGLTELVERRMESKALRGGWLGKRWNIDATLGDINSAEQEQGEATGRQGALRAVMSNLTHRDPRFQLIAAKVILGMEQMNQSDEHKSKPDVIELTGDVNLNVRAVTEALLNEPDYLAHVRHRAMLEDSDTGDVCEGGE